MESMSWTEHISWISIALPHIDFSPIMSITHSIIIIMIAFYLTQQIIETGDMVSILRTLMLAFATLIPFFLFCHFGGNVTTRFQDIGNVIYQLEWYNLPLDMQKDLLPFIALSQKRIYMRGYGDTRSTQSVFKKVRINYLT